MDIFQKANAILEKAIKADNEGRYKEAYNDYINGIQYYMHIMKYEKNEDRRRIFAEKSNEYLMRAEQLKEHLDKLEDKSETSEPSANGSTKEKKPSAENEDSESKKLRSALSSAILTEKPNVHWSDVAGLEGAKEALKEAVIMPVKFPIFSKETASLLQVFYFMVLQELVNRIWPKAVATEANSTFFSVSSSDLVSKWMGESERLIKQLFNLAKEQRPSIIFIDEVDALCGPRGEGESEASRRIKNELLIQMNGFTGDDKGGVLVLGATNIPWQLDAAMRRRFERRVYIPLPDIEARTRMFQLNVGDTPCDLSLQDFRLLAEMTEGYSGHDVAVSVRDALMQPIRKIQAATHFKQVTVKDPETGENRLKWTPCSPGDNGSQEMSWMDISGDELQEPPLTVKDFFKAIKAIKPTVSKDDIQKQVEFTNEFGQEGN